MSAFVLKLLALLSMVVDHMAAVLLYASPLYDPLRAFGRMAFLVSYDILRRQNAPQD